MRLFDCADADLDRFVAARSKLLTPGAKGWGRMIGSLQKAVLTQLRQSPLSVREIFQTVTFTTVDATVDLLAGLVARGLIENVDGKWRAKAQEAAA